MRWKPTDQAEKILEGSDPYFQWRLGAGATRCDPNPVRPVVVRLEEGKTARDLVRWVRARAAPDGSALRVPSFYTDPTKGLEGARWCTGLAEREFFKLLETDEPGRRERISRIAVLSEIAPPDEYADQLTDEELGEGEHSTKWPEDAVVIGIIDFGFAFAHERFRLTPTETRIEHLWVQDAPPARGQTASGAVPYGREITAGTINRWLAERDGRTDEGVLYGRAARLLGRGWLRSVSRRMAHGTHVLDLASGYSLDESERCRRPIVCVQLPEATVADTSGASLDSYVLDGIRYILERADEIASRTKRASLPVVINFSSGEVAGPHDGSSDLEQAIDELIELRGETAPLRVVISAGNSHLGRLHAQFEFENDGQTVALHWRVLPDDRTPSFLEIWLPRTETPSGEQASIRESKPGMPGWKSPVGLSIEAPNQKASESLDETTPGAGLRLLSDDGQVLCEARYRYVGPPTNRGMFLVAVQPTRSIEPACPGASMNAVAPSGTWIVTLVNTGGLGQGQPVEAWLQWDDAPLGFRRRGRQSYFDEQCYARFDAKGREIEEDTHPEQSRSCPVKRAGSMNAIATGRKTIVVGGYLRKEMRPAKYSAGGPISRAAKPVGKSGAAHRSGPDVAAVSDDSIVHRGVLAAGTRSGSVVALDGTSVAAPQITREIADWLAQGMPEQADGPRLSPARRAARGQRAPGRERIGAGLVEPRRPTGVTARGVRRFDRSDPVDQGGRAHRSDRADQSDRADGRGSAQAGATEIASAGAPVREPPGADPDTLAAVLSTLRAAAP